MILATGISWYQLVSTDMSKRWSLLGKPRKPGESSVETPGKESDVPTSRLTPGDPIGAPEPETKDEWSPDRKQSDGDAIRATLETEMKDADVSHTIPDSVPDPSPVSAKADKDDIEIGPSDSGVTDRLGKLARKAGTRRRRT